MTTKKKTNPNAVRLAVLVEGIGPRAQRFELPVHNAYTSAILLNVFGIGSTNVQRPRIAAKTADAFIKKFANAEGISLEAFEVLNAKGFAEALEAVLLEAVQYSNLNEYVDAEAEVFRLVQAASWGRLPVRSFSEYPSAVRISARFSTPAAAFVFSRPEDFMNAEELELMKLEENPAPVQEEEKAEAMKNQNPAPLNQKAIDYANVKMNELRRLYLQGDMNEEVRLNALKTNPFVKSAAVLKPFTAEDVKLGYFATVHGEPEMIVEAGSETLLVERACYAGEYQRYNFADAVTVRPSKVQAEEFSARVEAIVEAILNPEGEVMKVRRGFSVITKTKAFTLLAPNTKREVYALQKDFSEENLRAYVELVARSITEATRPTFAAAALEAAEAIILNGEESIEVKTKSSSFKVCFTGEEFSFAKPFNVLEVLKPFNEVAAEVLKVQASSEEKNEAPAEEIVQEAPEAPVKAEENQPLVQAPEVVQEAAEAFVKPVQAEAPVRPSTRVQKSSEVAVKLSEDIARYEERLNYWFNEGSKFAKAEEKVQEFSAKKAKAEARLKSVLNLKDEEKVQEAPEAVQKTPEAPAEELVQNPVQEAPEAPVKAEENQPLVQAEEKVQEAPEAVRANFFAEVLLKAIFFAAAIFAPVFFNGLKGSNQKNVQKDAEAILKDAEADIYEAILKSAFKYQPAVQASSEEKTEAPAEVLVQNAPEAVQKDAEEKTEAKVQNPVQKGAEAFVKPVQAEAPVRRSVKNQKGAEAVLKLREDIARYEERLQYWFNEGAKSAKAEEKVQEFSAKKAKAEARLKVLEPAAEVHAEEKNQKSVQAEPAAKANPIQDGGEPGAGAQAGAGAGAHMQAGAGAHMQAGAPAGAHNDVLIEKLSDEKISANAPTVATVKQDDADEVRTYGDTFQNVPTVEQDEAPTSRDNELAAATAKALADWEELRRLNIEAGKEAEIIGKEAEALEASGLGYMNAKVQKLRDKEAATLRKASKLHSEAVAASHVYTAARKNEAENMSEERRVQIEAEKAAARQERAALFAKRKAEKANAEAPVQAEEELTAEAASKLHAEAMNKQQGISTAIRDEENELRRLKRFTKNGNPLWVEQSEERLAGLREDVAAAAREVSAAHKVWRAAVEREDAAKAARVPSSTEVEAKRLEKVALDERLKLRSMIYTHPEAEVDAQRDIFRAAAEASKAFKEANQLLAA